MLQTHEFHFKIGGSSSSSHSYTIPVVGFAAGAALFASGFWTYRKLRVIETTPRIPVRSAAMGLVRVHGKVTGSYLLASPVTRTPCYYYHVRLERWDTQGKNPGWSIIHTERDQRVFYVDDGTGRLAVNPQLAEYDLPANYRAEFGPHARNAADLDPSLDSAAWPSEQELRAYAAKADPFYAGNQQVMAQLEVKYAQATGLTRRMVDAQEKALQAANPLTGTGSYRITEECMLAEHEYDVIGTCDQNPTPRDDQDRNLIHKGQNEPTFVISGFSELTLEKTLKKRAVMRILLGSLLMIFMAIFIIAIATSP